MSEPVFQGSRQVNSIGIASDFFFRTKESD